MANMNVVQGVIDIITRAQVIESLEGGILGTLNAELTNKVGNRFPIVPGMVANVEIKTGQKSVSDYLIKPLNKVN